MKRAIDLVRRREPRYTQPCQADILELREISTPFLDKPVPILARLNACQGLKLELRGGCSPRQCAGTLASNNLADGLDA